jgi:hypothetical protein
MTMAVRNRARLMITGFGGLCCTPMAVRSRPSTTTIRTNEVVMITIDGASDRTVSRPTICTTRSDRPAPVPRFTLIADDARAAAGMTTVARAASTEIRSRRGADPLASRR